MAHSFFQVAYLAIHSKDKSYWFEKETLSQVMYVVNLVYLQLYLYLCFLQLGLFNHVAALFYLIVRFKLSLTHFGQDCLLACECVH